MTKYAVYGTVTISITMLVEASDETESIIKAESEYPGLMNLVGNVVGSADSDICMIEAGDDIPEFFTAEEMDDVE